MNNLQDEIQFFNNPQRQYDYLLEELKRLKIENSFLFQYVVSDAFKKQNKQYQDFYEDKIKTNYIQIKKTNNMVENLKQKDYVFAEKGYGCWSYKGFECMVKIDPEKDTETQQAYIIKWHNENKGRIVMVDKGKIFTDSVVASYKIMMEEQNNESIIQ